MLLPLPLIVISVVSSVRAADILLLRQQCWHEHPLFTVDLQCSGEAELEYVQRPNATSNHVNNDDRATHGPWSYPPVCTDVLASVGSSLCVYTNTSFSHGRGISIFTTPELAEQILVLPPFQDPGALQGINEFTGTWYTQEMPGKGMGMLAKKDLKFKDRITAHTPALLAYLESDLSTAEREKFFKLAVSQLPKATRDMYLRLATVYGLPQVKYQDVVKANTFQLELGGHNHLAVFPETSRLNHACAPNAQYYLDPRLLTHFVHITRPVKEGEEITISCMIFLNLAVMRLI
jgi:hypothetical protein